MSKAHRLVAGAFAASLLTVSLAACGGGGNGGSVVTVNGQSISHGQLDKELENSPAARSTLQQMVMNDLIDQYGKDHHVNVTQADIAKVENRYKAQYPNGEWNQILKARGFTEKQAQDLIRRQIILDKAVGGNISVSQKQIAAYFAKNHAQFDQPAEVRARHILVANMKTAQKIEGDLKNGKSFSAEAKKYSLDPGSRAQGGELGWFRRGQMAPTFEQYAFSGAIGKISPPIKSPYGYHIIQVEGRKPAKNATLASVHGQIAQILRQQQEAPLVQPFLQQLQQGAKIQVNDPAFAGLFPSPAPAIAQPSAAPSTAASPAASTAPAPAAKPTK